jgi:hypothetical protein
VAGNLAKKDPKNEEFYFAHDFLRSESRRTGVAPVSIFEQTVLAVR